MQSIILREMTQSHFQYFLMIIVMMQSCASCTILFLEFLNQFIFMEGETGPVVGVLLNYIKSAQVKWLKSYPIPR